MPSLFSRFLSALGHQVAKHPGRVIGFWLAAVLLAGLACLRLSPGARLSDMLGDSSPEASAFNHVMDHYALADELIVVITAQDGKDAAPGVLQKQAEAAAATLSESVELRQIGAKVRPDPAREAQSFMREKAIRRAVSYLPEDALQRLNERLGEAEMRRFFAVAKAHYSQASIVGATADQQAKDPLNLREFLPLAFPLMKEQDANGQDFSAMAQPAASADAAYELSKDGKCAVIHLYGAHAATDMPKTEAVVAGAERALAPLQGLAKAQGLRIELAGPYALAATSARTAKHDFTWSTFETIGLIILAYFVIYRRPHGLHLLVACTFIPLLAGFGVYALVCGRITPLIAVAGAVLAGLGIDYAIQSLHHHQRLRKEGLPEAEATRRTVTEQAMPLLGACISACMGFAAIAATRTPAMKQLALLAVLCLFAALLAALTLLPAALALISRWKAKRAGAHADTPAMEARLPVGRLAVWTAQKPKTMLAAFGLLCALGVAGAIAGYLHPARGVGLYALHPSPNPALEAQKRIARHFDRSEGVALALVRSDNLWQTCAAMRQAGQAAGWQVMSLADLVPQKRRSASADHEMQGRPKPSLPSGQEAYDRLLACAKAEGFTSPKALKIFTGYAAFLRDNLDLPAPTLADLPPHLASMLLPKGGPATPTETLAVLIPRHPWDSADARDADIFQLRGKMAQVPGVVLTGPDVLSVVMRAQVREDLPLALGLAALGIFLWHALTCRKVLDTALSLIPSLAGLLAAASLAYLRGIEWNAITLAALPLIMGTGVDGNLFMVLFARERAGQGPGKVLEEFDKGTLAMLMIALTTLAGFGTLAFGSTPAVRDLGLLTSVGVAGAVFTSFACIMPVLWLAEKRRCTQTQSP